MRKALLAIAVLIISSVAADADPYLRVAENGQPPAPAIVITTEPSGPAQPESKTVEPAKEVESKTIAPEPTKTAAEPEKATEPAATADTKPAQAQKAKARVSRRESDEQKARRIAAKFGVYW